MSEQEMNSYRFCSNEDPSDEMLAQIMKEVAEEAREKNAKATEAYFAQMNREIADEKALWAERIREALHE